MWQIKKEVGGERVCESVRERMREKDKDNERERERERERESVIVCVWERETESEGESERKSVCVWVRESERLSGRSILSEDWKKNEKKISECKKYCQFVVC